MDPRVACSHRTSCRGVRLGQGAVVLGQWTEVSDRKKSQRKMILGSAPPPRDHCRAGRPHPARVFDAVTLQIGIQSGIRAQSAAGGVFLVPQHTSSMPDTAARPDAVVPLHQHENFSRKMRAKHRRIRRAGSSGWVLTFSFFLSAASPGQGTQKGTFLIN